MRLDKPYLGKEIIDGCEIKDKKQIIHIIQSGEDNSLHITLSEQQDDIWGLEENG